jgi:N-acyl homoserine lactone hydrolase
VFLRPTPGHTDGHQSLVVRQSDRSVIVARQTHDTATGFAVGQVAWRAPADGYGLDPRLVYFAHDRSVWIL